MFFVVSAGRSGSKTIAAALNGLPGCRCVHHAKPELVFESAEFFCGTHPREHIAQTLRETRPAGNGMEAYGEANLQYTLIVPILCEVFPDCKFIWIIRDGRDQVASTFYRGWYDPDVDPQRNPRWSRARLCGDRTGDFTPRGWARLTPFQRCSWQWRKFNLIAEDSLAKLPESRWRKVRLDQLKLALPELAEFVGASSRDGRVEKLNTARQPVDYWQNWTGEQRQQFEEICGTEMDRWFPEWRDPDGTWNVIPHEQPDHPGQITRAWRRIKRLPGVARLARRLWGV